jgi:hypothetical protein
MPGSRLPTPDTPRTPSIQPPPYREHVGRKAIEKLRDFEAAALRISLFRPFAGDVGDVGGLCRGGCEMRDGKRNVRIVQGSTDALLRRYQCLVSVRIESLETRVPGARRSDLQHLAGFPLL